MAVLTRCALRLRRAPRHGIVGSWIQHSLYTVFLTGLAILPRLVELRLGGPWKDMYSFAYDAVPLLLMSLLLTYIFMGVFCYCNRYICKPDVTVLDYMIYTSALTYVPTYKALGLMVPSMRLPLFVALVLASSYYLSNCYMHMLAVHRPEAKALHFLYMLVTMSFIVGGLDITR